MKLIVNALLVLICSAAGVLLLIYLFQSKLIYPAPLLDLKEPVGDNIEVIALGDAYGYLLTPADEEVRFPVVIFTHGNGELAEQWVPSFSNLVEQGFAVLIVEYPGYGRANGKPNYDSIKHTKLMAYDAVTSRENIDGERVVAYGRSLGGAAAALLAENRRTAALVLESTFSSLPKLVSEKGFPSFLLKDRFDNETIVKNLDIPILIYHGTADTIIPFSHAETLDNANPNTVLISGECGHNNCPRIWEALLVFFKNRVL